MNESADRLAEDLVCRLQKLQDPNRRLLVGIAGIPASGKSTFAVLVVDNVNVRLAKDGERSPAILVGLDGWHLTRTQLDAMEDPKLAHDRRGAHWTFDAASYLSFVRRLREPLDGPITAPSFDHALKDPTPDAVSIQPYHRIVVIEGLYTMLNADIWKDAAALLDERWWVHIDLEEAKRRLVKRHVATGVAKDMEEAIWRAEENDGPNGEYIAENLYEQTLVITSVDDPAHTLP
ncbi:P-loop containing nucleoside triphosphate hydrolase protein [Phlebopus sp. FC_14]|nr:P-loop containing nucleoside triphosphate hydrolase protein [Phlebopus sp. FC_14]